MTREQLKQKSQRNKTSGFPFAIIFYKQLPNLQSQNIFQHTYTNLQNYKLLHISKLSSKTASIFLLSFIHDRYERTVLPNL